MELTGRRVRSEMDVEARTGLDEARRESGPAAAIRLTLQYFYVQILLQA
jgi:hypothetical protein